ncbi:MAG TPA: hypothetical protein VF892_05095, partial [Pseudonocardiaceae bacterium]
ALSGIAGPGDPLDWLAAGGDVRTDVRAVLSWSYRRLHACDPLAAKVFRLLGRYPDGTPDEVAAVAGVPRQRARHLIAVLAHANLVQQLPGDRYRMHDLLRAYAGGLADEEAGMPTVGVPASPIPAQVRTA